MKSPQFASSVNLVGGWIKFQRSPYSDQLLRDPFAFALLSLIAIRAWRGGDGINAYDLAPGEALVGDSEYYGMTRRQYRTRLDRLREWKLITYRTTRKGTIARLISTSVFDINERSNE